ncbi:hypothetical protein BCR44DRAFT_1451759 [Catenaria anguillulae PL171]|uniref:Uncharacterized protein n=1 Tax=Catenaria anguillulae PL171 TaxID=765915 RepID=A0A1Y2H471_9FUNG|nr:hypothetical protein BCR44DRAFT_1451759 [Catenaria anguillulae PL171]
MPTCVRVCLSSDPGRLFLFILFPWDNIVNLDFADIVAYELILAAMSMAFSHELNCAPMPRRVSCHVQMRDNESRKLI